MNEVYEFRLFEEEAQRHLGPDVGTRRGLARIVVASPPDPAFKAIKKVQRQLVAAGDSMIASWNVRRTYTSRELAQAEAFRLYVEPTFEPSGEQCGTTYDVSGCCDLCGVGRRQTSPLRLEESGIPSTDLSNTIAREVVIASRTASSLKDRGVSGVAFGDVEACRAPSATLAGWKQVQVEGRGVRIVGPTIWGHTPFDDAPRGSDICERGHVGGVNVLSEVFLERSTWSGADFALTDQHEGVPMGLIRPWPVLVISRRVWLWLYDLAATGWRAEIAHLV